MKGKDLVSYASMSGSFLISSIRSIGLAVTIVSDLNISLIIPSIFMHEKKNHIFVTINVRWNKYAYNGSNDCVLSDGTAFGFNLGWGLLLRFTSSGWKCSIQTLRDEAASRPSDFKASFHFCLVAWSCELWVFLV